LLPRLRFLISQLPPCSGRPAQLLAPDTKRPRKLKAELSSLSIQVRTWYCSSALTTNLCFDILRSAASMHILRVGRLGNNSVQLVRRDELSFTLIPCCQNLLNNLSVILSRKLLFLDKPLLKVHIQECPDGLNPRT
jgi:hypothetical protein